MNGSDVDAFEDAPSTRSLLEYLEIPLWYPKQMWTPFVVIMLIALLGVYFLPRKYRSSTMIMVEPKKVADYFVMPMAADGIAQRLNTIRQIVLSRTGLEKIVRSLTPYPELANQPPQVVADFMRKAISIKVQGSDSFIIEYVSSSPKMAMAVTNALAQQFVSDSTFLRDNMTEKTYEFIQSNLEDTRKVLEAREEALRQHKLKYWGALPEQLDSNLRLMQQLQGEQQTVAENMRTLVERRGDLERGLAEADRLGPAAVGASSRVAELAKLKANYAALRDRYTEEYPDVRAAKHKIERLEEAIASGPTEEPSAAPQQTSPEIIALHRQLQVTEAEIDKLNERRTALDARIAAFQARVEETPKAEQELMALTRDYNQIRDQYNAMLKKEMDAEMSRKLETYWKDGYFRILDPAHLPQAPIRPYALMLSVGGLVLGLLAGLACSVAADFLDNSMKNARQLETLLPEPILVTLPRLKARRSRRAPAIAATPA